MNKIKQKLRRITCRYHMVIHILIGLLASLIVRDLFPNYNYSKIVSFSIIGSILPDIDHLLYIFWYKKKEDYAKDARAFLKKYHIKAYINFVKENHKKLTDVYSHNLFTVLLFTAFCHLYFSEEKVLGVTLCLSIIFHLLFDVVEDFLLLGKLNSNWILRFGRDNSNKYKSTEIN
ncbi:MAG: metal-dependent hydrolase [Patescibacteria group bacterium]